MQDLLSAGHPGLVHLRVEDRMARIIQVLQVPRMALDMAIGVVVARDIGVDREANRYSALYPSSGADAQFRSGSGVEPFSDIRSLE